MRSEPQGGSSFTGNTMSKRRAPALDEHDDEATVRARQKPSMRTSSFLVAACLAPLLASCAFSSRAVSLQNYEPIVGAGSFPALEGKRVAITLLDDKRTGPDAVKDVPATPDPPGYRYLDISPAATEKWTAGARAAEASGAQKHLIGCVRNGFGMRTADVFALDAPTTWLRETIERELENQGATIAEKAETADITLSMTLRHLDADLYFTVSCRMVVDVQVATGGAPKNFTLNVKGSKTAVWGSSWEYYLAIREAQQKLMWHVLRAMTGSDPPTVPKQTDSDFGG